jgi:preprotein translocase SecE subunit
VARDRQRAKARKQRREPTPPKRDGGDGVADERDSSRHLHRENVPGPVEHTGDVDEFEAALVAGADGEAEPDPDAAERASLGEDSEPLSDGEEAPFAGEEPPATEAPRASVATRSAPTPGENVHGRGGGRFLNFLRASWAELQRVQWPDRRQVGQATTVVIGFVIIAGLYLGAADWVAQRIVDFIL